MKKLPHILIIIIACASVGYFTFGKELVNKSRADEISGVQKIESQKGEAPKIVYATENDEFYPGDYIDIYFDQIMDTDKTVLHFSTEGVPDWVNSRHFRFRPTIITAGQTITYYAEKLIALNDGVSGKSEEYAVRIPGEIQASVIEDKDEKNNFVLRIQFDQHIVHSSAENNFNVSPNIAGTIYWQDNSMFWKPDSRLPSQSLTFTLASGVVSQMGTKTAQDITYIKKEILPIKKLAVPYFKQQYLRSCESASARMALAYFGIEANDFDIVSKVGYAPTDWDKINSIWTDPYNQFVGFIDEMGTGYGTYAPAIEKAVKTFGINAKSYTNIDAKFLANQIYDGKPVEVWGYFTPTPKDKISWKTTDGKNIEGYSGEHARLVIGVLGSRDNPIGFYVHDPLYEGANKYWPAQKLIDHMNTFGELSNQAVVIWK